MLNRKRDSNTIALLNSECAGTASFVRCDHTARFTDDAAGRLIQEDLNHFDDQFDRIDDFVYDLAGNRRSMEVDLGRDGSVDRAIEYLYDANDRLETESLDLDGDSLADQTTEYEYDHTQQTVKRVKAGDATGPRTAEVNYSYDLQGRMRTVVSEAFDETTGDVTSRERVTYDYDENGIRVRAAEEVDTTLGPTGVYQPTRTTDYLVDHLNRTGYQQVIQETVFEQGEVVETIEYTFGHDEISQKVTEYTSGTVTQEQTHIFGHDGHTSVRLLFDVAAAIEQLFSYTAYGELLAIHDGLGAESLAEASTTLLYSGEPFDSRIGQQYLRARYYDPANGRFNRLDPFVGNVQDPQSLHKYAYVHGDPIGGVDPTGLFASVSGLLASFGIQSETRSQEGAAKGSQGAATTKQLNSVAKIYDKALKIFNKFDKWKDKVEDFLDYAEIIHDLVSLDPSSYSDLKNALAGKGITAAIGAAPNEVVDKRVKLPRAMLNKFKSIRRIAYHVARHHVVQEFMGEIATAAVIHSLGFELAPLSIHQIAGPDQVAKHSSDVGLWGIFEAKGGSGKLGHASYGRQMSGDWIGYWIRKMISTNRRTEYGRELRRAFEGPTSRDMLAAVTRLNLKTFGKKVRLVEFRVAAQRFDPPTGNDMQPWGKNWT